MSTATMDATVEARFAGAMAELGADASGLAAAAREELDGQGYTVLPGIIDRAWLARLRSRLDELLARGGRLAHAGSHAPAAMERSLLDLVNEGEVFDRLWTHPRVLDAVRHVLGRPFKLSDLNFREPLRGGGRQGLHADWDARAMGEAFHVVNSLWLLDDYTADNGATRLVPGSHLLAWAGNRRPECEAPHPEERVLIAAAGSVVVFNAHLWHGGTVNTGGARRRMITAYYVGREHPYPGLDQGDYMRLRTWERLGPAQRWLSGVA